MTSSVAAKCLNEMFFTSVCETCLKSCYFSGPAVYAAAVCWQPNALDTDLPCVPLRRQVVPLGYLQRSHDGGGYRAGRGAAHAFCAASVFTAF